MVDVPDENSTIINEVFKANDAWPADILRLKLTEAVIEMTKAEMGASILAEWSIQPYLERGELVAIPLARKVVRNWYSVSLKKRALPNFMCVFVDELETALATKDIARMGL
jgi:LysR family transcriptional regulator for metE and metH